MNPWMPIHRVTRRCVRQSRRLPRQADGHGLRRTLQTQARTHARTQAYARARTHARTQKYTPPHTPTRAHVGVPTYALARRDALRVHVHAHVQPHHLPLKDDLAISQAASSQEHISYTAYVSKQSGQLSGPTSTRLCCERGSEKRIKGRGVKEGGLISARRRIRVTTAMPLSACLGRARSQDTEHAAEHPAPPLLGSTAAT